MKKLIQITFLLLFSNFGANAQSCSPYFYDQKDIDNFHKNYPGCKTLLNLELNHTGIKDLKGLLGVTKVE
ncbi:MAG TPA: hypothetical protein VK590_15490 [Saprospiraceae bacterium]|nr:hypothetical protein [Saprospiraceae bacterium]